MVTITMKFSSLSDNITISCVHKCNFVDCKSLDKLYYVVISTILGSVLTTKIMYR